MHDPHLVSCAAGGDIKTLLEEFLIAQRESTVLGGVDQGDEHHVAFVALELRGVSAEHAMEFVAVGGNVRADEGVDFDGLLVSHQIKYSEAQLLARVSLP